MKNIIFLLVFLPIFLMSSLHFYDGNIIPHPPIQNKAFTCTACHATIIDGIIINGSQEGVDDFFTEVDVVFPDDVPFNTAAIAIKESKKPIFEYFDVNNAMQKEGIYLFDAQTMRSGKKENSLTIKVPTADLIANNNKLTIEGVLSNLDNTAAGDYSFSKTLQITDKVSLKASKIILYPSLAKDILHIKNIPEGAQLLIYSIKGEMVAHQQIKENEAIDISNLPNGQYFAHIETVKDKLQTQFLVQK